MKIKARVLRNPADARPDLEEIERRLKMVAQRQARVNEMYEMNMISRDEYMKKTEALKLEKAELEAIDTSAPAEELPDLPDDLSTIPTTPTSPIPLGTSAWCARAAPSTDGKR